PRERRAERPRLPSAQGATPVWPGDRRRGMFRSTTSIRFRRLLLVGAVVAVAIVPTASAVGRPPDVQDAASATLAAQVSPPDVRDTALRISVAVPDVIERYAAAHPYGLGLSSVATAVSRPPDISDAALSAQYASLPASNAGFSWTDWAIGIGSGIGLALLLAGCAMASRQVRHRVQTA